MKKLVANIGRRFGLLGFIVLALFASSAAQNVRNTDFSPDKSLKSNARVNPSTLAMELSIPLGGYVGRSGNGLPYTLSYSSKVWEMRSLPLQWQSSLGSTVNDVRPTFAKHSVAGWTSSLGTPQIEYEWDDYQASTQEAGTYDGQIYAPAYWEDPPNTDLFYVKRLHVRMPDGSSHEFRASDAAIDCGSVSEGCTSTDFTGTFLSVDGTRMRLDSDLSASTLYMPNGSRYIFGAPSIGQDGNPATTYYNRHGNKMTFNITTRVWTDTMGRALTDPTVTINSTPVGVDQTVSYPGFGSSPYELDFVWNNLANVFENTSDTVRYDSSKLCSGNVHTSQSPYLFTSSDSYTRLCGTNYTFNPVVLSRVTLPNGQFYEFKYNVYGEITRVRYPTGAYERFIYGEIAPISIGNTTYDMANRGVTNRYVSVKGDGTDETQWSYTAIRGTPLAPAPYTVTTYAPDGSITQQLIHDEPNMTVTRPFGFGSALTGRAYDERSYDNSSNHALLSRNLTEYIQTGALSGGYAGATRDMRPSKEISIIFDPANSNALATMTETVYDTAGNSDPAYFSSLNAKQQKTYNYIVISASTASGSVSPAQAAAWFDGQTPAVVNEMDYLYDANYKARNINGLVTETRVEDASGNVKAKSQTTYDGASLLNESTSTRWENPNTNYRGLVTQTRSGHDIANNLYIDSQAQYDLMGNLRYTTDGRGNVSETQYSPTYDYAYPTSATTPAPQDSGGSQYGSTTGLTSSTAYDYNTGLPTSATDANGQMSQMEYNDSLLRPTKVTAPNGHQSITEYGAGTSNSTRWVKSRSQIDASTWKEGYSYFDGLGRTVRSQSVDDDGDVFTLACYDTMGRVSKATNPFRGYTNQDCTTTTGLEWTTNTFDTAGRPWKVTTPDGAVVETLYSLATSGSEIGTVVTVKDQALKERRSVTNALGHLKRVDEPTTSGLGAIDTPNQPTSYAYDYLNNLTTVYQGVQTRSFAYDNMSRLKSANNPESGTINYTYDANSNVATKIDARSISTTYTYDRLNRVTFRNYSDTTPDVTYFYDNLTNAKGKLLKVSSSVSTTEYTALDTMGRITAHQQTTDGTAYTTGYAYNLSGALIEETYPSGRVVKNTLDNSGDLAVVQSKKTSTAGFFSYGDAFTYNPAGAVTSMQLGNGKWESTTFNNRLQPTQIALGTVQNGTDKLKLSYAYGNTQNNGNVLTQDITVIRSGQSPLVFNQTYTYDELNRLKSAQENSGTNWKQTYSFDRYGNRNFDSGNTNQPTVLDAVTNPSFNTANNRMNSGQGYSFDAAGNVTADAIGQSYVYDAENKQTAVSNGSIGQYFYDGDGKRVKKVVPNGETTIFVYDAAAKLVAEYSTVVTPIPDAKVAYVTNDHLGSPRINTDRDGNTTSRHDYHPYGEEVFTSQRTTNLNYAGDTVRKQFTGYERDIETGLDFAQARYFGSSLGRFTSPDPLLASGRAENPQTWNRYVYVGNNPLNITDPAGLDWYGRTTNGRTNYLWSEDNKTFADGSSVDGWDAVDLGFTGELAYQGCSNADCSETATAYLRGGGSWEWAGFARDMRRELGNSVSFVAEEFRNGFPKLQRDIDFIASDPLGERGLGNPGLAFVTGGLSSGVGGFARSTGAAASTVSFEQYTLRAAREGLYPIMQRGSAEPVGEVLLRSGDVWKFGETMNPATRYSQSFLDNTGAALRYVPEFTTPSFRQVLQVEKQKILAYEKQFGALPPGNKIRR